MVICGCVQVWHDLCQLFFQALKGHLSTLLSGCQQGVPVPSSVKQAVPIDLIRAVLPHTSEAGRAVLRQMLMPIT